MKATEPVAVAVAEELNVALNRLQRLLSSRSVHARHAEAAGLGLPQQAIQVLRALDGEPACPVAEVARAARMDVGAVSRQLRVLEDEGLARRRPSPTNASVVLAEVTERGARAAASYRAVGAQFLADALAQWDPEERQLLGALLLRLVEDFARTPYRPLSPG